MLLAFVLGSLILGPDLLVAGSHGLENLSAENSASRRHPFVQTIADVFVGRHSMTVRISSSADELDLIHGIIPEEDGFYVTDELLEGIDIHADFLLERFEIYDSEGKRVPGSVVEKPDWEIPARIESGRLVDYMLDFVFEYSFDEPPEFLTFQNYIIDFNFALPSEVKLVVKQAGSNAPYSDVLKIKQPKNVRFDWDKPLQNHLSGEELREWFQETREKTLGLTSYGGVYSFVYVTPRQVRHEVLIPMANLIEFMNFEQADRWYLDVAEQDAAIAQIKEFFSKGNPLTINGERVMPHFDRFVFAGLDVQDFGMNAERKRISVANGRVGVIMSFPTSNIPDEVTVTWDKFSKMLRNVDVILVHPQPYSIPTPIHHPVVGDLTWAFGMDMDMEVIGEKTSSSQFSRYLEENTLTWQNDGVPPLPNVVDVQYEAKLTSPKIPTSSYWCWGIGLLVFFVGLVQSMGSKKVLTITAAAAVATVGGMQWSQTPGVELPISDEQTDEVFADLHQNLFRAFDFHAEEDVYDALAQTTHGPLLKEIYLNMRRSLEMKEQGGAVTNLDRIEIISGHVLDESIVGTILQAPDFTYQCTWELEGTVEHWGHIHRRTNRYVGKFNVQNIDGYWKLTDFLAIDAQQGPVVRSLRKF